MLRQDDGSVVANVVPLMTDDLDPGRVDVGDSLLRVRVSKDDDGADLGHGIGIQVGGSVMDSHTALGVAPEDESSIGTLGNGRLYQVGTLVRDKSARNLFDTSKETEKTNKSCPETSLPVK